MTRLWQLSAKETPFLLSAAASVPLPVRKHARHTITMCMAGGHQSFGAFCHRASLNAQAATAGEIFG